jgi:hypothetical protein
MDPYLNRFISPDPWEGSIYQPGTLHKYVYVLNNPINLADPSGHNGELPQYSYTAYGWIDTSHIGAGNPRTLIQDVTKAAREGGGRVHVQARISAQVEKFDLGVWFESTYWVDGQVTEDQIQGVALGILIDWSNRFETWQGTFMVVPQLSKSSFAIEDLPSNFLGFYKEVSGKSNKDIVMEDLGGCITPPGSEPPDRWSWQLDDAKSFVMQPKALDESGQWVYRQWPTHMQSLLDSAITEEEGLWHHISMQDTFWSRNLGKLFPNRWAGEYAGEGTLGDLPGLWEQFGAGLGRYHTSLYPLLFHVW